MAAGEAAAKVKKTLQQIGMDPDTVRRAAIVAYEAEMNIVIHAHQGVLTALISPECIEIIAEDEGSGIADVDLAMREGFSTAPDEIRELGFGAGMVCLTSNGAATNSIFTPQSGLVRYYTRPS
jgi:anti-sigma regulatory factor (Ser/Thr protein kinase)